MPGAMVENAGVAATDEDSALPVRLATFSEL
jgi:hypothetical protein